MPTPAQSAKVMPFLTVAIKLVNIIQKQKLRNGKTQKKKSSVLK